MIHMTVPPRVPADEASNDHAECYVSHAVRDTKFNTPGFPRAPIQPSSPPYYRIGKAPDQYGPEGGPAMYATRHIKQGELIFSERLLLIAGHLFLPKASIFELIRIFTSVESLREDAHRDIEENVHGRSEDDQNK